MDSAQLARRSKGTKIDPESVFDRENLHIKD